MCCLFHQRAKEHQKSRHDHEYGQKSVKMDLIRQMAMSGPIRNCMNIMATRPPMVVRLLAQISGMPLRRAAMTASRRGSV